MIQGILRSWSTYLGAAALFTSLAACTIQEAPKRTPLNTTPDDRAALEQPESSIDPLEPETNEDSGAFGKPGTTSSSSGTIATKKFCSGALKAGDLAIVEIMIASKSGSGDSGEWVEIRSTRDCWLHLAGVSVESPRGTSGVDTASVSGAVDLAPNGTFVVADSDDATKNHGLTGTVLSWDATDVLKNDGDTITVKLGEVQIDKVTYPNLAAATAGNSVAFPADCESADRSDWLKWTASTDEYGALKGTPNGPNSDVACK
ncbi:MAG: hypothetical protein U0270_07790 [Labilithrix sp.]